MLCAAFGTGQALLGGSAFPCYNQRMDTHVRHFWQAHRLGQSLTLVGLSGGADSLALLSALHAAGLPVLAAHFDHALRPDSAQDARYVQQVCADLGVPLVTGRGDVAALAQRERLSLEDAARRARYTFLFAQAQAHAAQAVAVAHTADDQAETVLMHLLMGSGLPGLRGMQPVTLPNPWSESIPLLRPLLPLSRREVLAWCQKQGLQPLLDASNLERRFLRNRLRLDVLPLLETCNPQVRGALLRSAHLAGEAEAALQQWAAQAAEQCLHVHAGDCIQVDWQALCALPRAVQRRVLRNALSALGGNLREIGYQGLERVRTLRNGARLPVTSGLRALRESDGLWLLSGEAAPPVDAWPQADEAALGVLPLPGERRLRNGWRIRARWVESLPEALAAARGNRDPMRAWISLPGARACLSIRQPRAGLRLHPLGMGERRVKVFDLMSNAHIPQRARARWPLVYVEDTLAWVPGLRLDERFRLRSDTRRAVCLCCCQTG